ncbi:MAG: MFS transporter [Bacteroidetes bacterium]|nr:MFS transporter [Bacteroidota bacterium]
MSEQKNNGMYLAVIAAALGYFVDLYDIVLFGVVRVSSLQAIGITGDELISKGILLQNLQFIGMLIGGVAWGIIGDKMGRKWALLATITLYSTANVANGFINDIDTYALLRFIAGFGLAGELGAGITLVSEILPKQYRGYGTTVISFLGLIGALTASYVGGSFDWRVAYFVGGGMGFLVLALRMVTLQESSMFEQQRKAAHSHGDVLMFFRSGALMLKLLMVIAVGIPIWYVSGIIITFSPEFGSALNLSRSITAAETLKWQAIGLAVGSGLSGILSEWLKSRKRVVWASFILMAVLTVVTLNMKDASADLFMLVVLVVGLGQGYWTVFLTMAAENFGTNIRATVATSVPNFVRSMVVPMSLWLNSVRHDLGLINSALMIGGIVFLIAFTALWFLKETYGKDINYIETA